MCSSLQRLTPAPPSSPAPYCSWVWSCQPPAEGGINCFPHQSGSFCSGPLPKRSETWTGSLASVTNCTHSLSFSKTCHLPFQTSPRLYPFLSAAHPPPASVTIRSHLDSKLNPFPCQLWADHFPSNMKPIPLCFKSTE